MNDAACDAYPRLRLLALPQLFALDIKRHGMVLDPVIPRGTGLEKIMLKQKTNDAAAITSGVLVLPSAA